MGSSYRYLLRALSYVRQYWLLTVIAYFCLAVTNGSMLLAPLLVRRAVDAGMLAGNLAVVKDSALLILALALFRGVFSFLRAYLSELVSQNIAYDIRNELYAHLQSLSFSYHDRAQTGQLMTRATSDVEAVRGFIGRGLIQIVNSIVMIAATMAILFFLHWRLALVAAIAVPIMLAAVGFFASRMQPLFRSVQQRLADLSTLLQENLAGVRVVKSFSREPYEMQRFASRNISLLDANLRVTRWASWGFPTLFLAANLATLAIVWYGGVQVIRGSISLGTLVAFATYLGILMWPVGMLGFMLAMLARASASAERVFEILDVPVEIKDQPGAIPLPPVEGHVRFENVSFAYFRGEQVLDNISFEVKPGETVALLGETGSGKSTIINLIPRFYDVSSGSITIDGYDIRDVTLESLRRQIGIVLQETQLFAGTIRDNIAFGMPEADIQQVIEAAKAAEAHGFIESFPEGYDTIIGERGVTLSGGQRQRVAIARALLLDPRILILDDATSSVDVETEYLIQRALARLRKGRTSFVIAQRLSTVRDADLILVLDRGRLVAQGKHEELLERSPIYSDIYGQQLMDSERELFGDAEFEELRRELLAVEQEAEGG